MATPVITSALIMLFIDRNYGGSFFDPSRGGDAILYQNIFWFYSHPAVYVMILPAMGMVSEILPVFSRKPLFGYKAFVFATAAIGALGFSVWAHHMFTTGAVYLPFFSIMTFLIAVPTGVKMFNWVFTMWRGQLMLKTPLLFALGFLSMFLIGGINGAFSASVPVDFALHDTYWVVAHLHYVLFGGSVFGVMAGFYYWFPKMTGRMMNETVGKAQFVLMFIGFNLTFFPMHELGLAGMPRRIADYSSTAGWNDLNIAGHDRRVHDRGEHGPAPVERLPVAAQRRRSPATTRGRATPSSGRRPRRRPPTTSTTCPRSARSGRSSTSGTAGRPSTEGRPMAMTTDTHPALPVEHNPLASMPHDTHGGISNPVLGMLLFITSEVMFFGGLFAAYFNIRANAAQWPPINPETTTLRAGDPAVRRAGHDPADPQLVHLPVGGLGDPPRRPDGLPAVDGRHGHPRHRLPADAADRLRAPRIGGPDPVVRAPSARPTTR